MRTWLAVSLTIALGCGEPAETSDGSLADGGDGDGPASGDGAPGDGVAPGRDAAGADGTPTDGPAADAPPPATGSLDPDFGAGGVAFLASPGHDYANDLAVQPDGKIVVGGQAPGGMLILRFLPDGTLDPAFGVDGKVVLEAPDFDGAVKGVALQPDGKIVAAGHVYRLGTTRWGVVRLTPSGALDPSFGTAGLAVPFETKGGAEDVALRPDGTIVLGGYQQDSGSVWSAQVAQLTSAGSVDTSFGAGGTTVVTSTYGVAILAVDLQADGALVTAGRSQYSYPSGAGSRFWVARFALAGALDPTFDGGQVWPSFSGTDSIALDVLVQPDGRIVAAGHALSSGEPDHMALCRLGADGAGDPSFGTGGLEAWVVGRSASGAGLALQADGRLVVAGGAFLYGSSQRHVALARRLSDGSGDATFGDSGALAFTVGPGDAWPTEVALAPDGALYVVGWAATATGYDDLFLAKVR